LLLLAAALSNLPIFITIIFFVIIVITIFIATIIVIVLVIVLVFVVVIVVIVLVVVIVVVIVVAIVIVARLDQDWQHGPQVSALPCSCLQLGAYLPVGSTQGSVEGLAEVRGRSLPPAEAQVARSLSRLSRQP